MDLALAIAQGFHNAPRLYGDSTVRTPTRISGIQSGLRAAGKEFIFGIYDGVSGLFLQPYNGAKQGGPLGFVQGLGKGFGGFVLKDIAAVIGPIGYTLKGVHKELVKGKKLTGFIRRARMIQGEDDLKELNDRDKKAVGEKIEAAWNIVEEIRREIKLTREEGLEGKVAVMIGKRRFSKQGAFESVESSRMAFLAWKNERATHERGTLDARGVGSGGDGGGGGPRKMWTSKEEDGTPAEKKKRWTKSVGSVKGVPNELQSV